MQIHNLPAQTTAADADVLAIDNGTTTQKITVANIKKEMIGDADISSLSTDGTVTAALSKLNTDFVNIPNASSLNAILTERTQGRTYPFACAGDVSSIITNGQAAAAGKGFFAKWNNTTVDFYVQTEASGTAYATRYNLSTSTVESVTNQPTRAEVNTLFSNIGNNTIVRSLTASDYDAGAPASDYLRIMWGHVDGYGIISLDLSWVRIQFRTNGTNTQWRVRYGSANPTTWTAL